MADPTGPRSPRRQLPGDCPGVVIVSGGKSMTRACSLGSESAARLIGGDLISGRRSFAHTNLRNSVSSFERNHFVRADPTPLMKPVPITTVDVPHAAPL